MDERKYKVSIAVSSKFHYTNYVKYIDQKQKLESFFYSHKISTTASSLGINKKNGVNIFIKEYFAYAHNKLFGAKSKMTWLPFYHDLWESIALLSYKKVSIFHTINHGSSRRLLKKYKRDGAVTIGEPVNTHPLYMNQLLVEEYERLGLKGKVELQATQKRMIEEIPLFDYLITPSKFVKNSYVLNGFAEDRIFDLPFGVDINKFRKFNSSEGIFNRNKIFKVIYVAQIIPRKAHIDLLEAWKKLNLPDAELIFIGGLSNEMIPILKRYEGLYKHLGTVSHYEIIRQLNDASAFVMPSIEEGCAFAAIEAMACGVPVILSTNTGTCELVTEGKEGFIIPIRRPDLIAEKLEMLYKNRSIVDDMGNNARILAESTLSWEQYADRLINIYDNVYNMNHVAI